MLHPRIKVEGVELKVEKDLFGYDNVAILFVAKGKQGRRYLVYCSDMDMLDYSIASVGPAQIVNILKNVWSAGSVMLCAKRKYRVTLSGFSEPHEAIPVSHPGMTPTFLDSEVPKVDGMYGDLNDEVREYLGKLILEYEKARKRHEYRSIIQRFAFDEEELLRTIRVDTLPVTIEKTPWKPLGLDGMRCKVTAKGMLIAEYFIETGTNRCYLLELRRLEVSKSGVTGRQILDFGHDVLAGMAVPGRSHTNAQLSDLEKRLREGIHAFNLTVAASVAAATFCAMYATGLKHPPKPRPIDLRAWHLIRAAASGNFGMAVINLWKMTTEAQQGKPIYRVYWNDRIAKNDSMQFTDRQEAFRKAWDMRRESTVNYVSVDMITEIAEPIRESEWNPMYDILKKPTGGFNGNND